MRMVIQVAKAELRNLFYSPIAWFLLIAFFVQCAWFYISPLESVATWQDILLKNDPKYKGAEGGMGLTRGLFLGDDGFFSNVLQNLYLFIPLLTMGLIGREVQNGTIKLLYSSPLKIRQIVLGKFVAIMVFNLALVLIVGVFFVLAVMNIQSVDYGMLLAACLGFFLVACTYAAIGAFMSSLTTYQVVAAVSTFMIILVLTFIGNFWQQYDFIRDLTYFLFLSGRTEKMVVGLIKSKDVIYFLIVITMFLVITMMKLRAARESKPWYVKMGRYLGVVCLALMLGYLSSRPAVTLYWDTTQQKVNTINYKTQELIKEMGDEPLEVILYTNFLGPGSNAGLPAARNPYLSWVWEKYTRFKPDIRFKYEYYYDHDSSFMGNHIYKQFPNKSLEQIVQKLGEYMDADVSYFQKPEEMRRKIDLRPEELRLVMQLKYKGRTEYLRTFNDTEFWPNENHFAAAFKRLLDPENIPHVQFVTGHYERSIYKNGEREYADHTAGRHSRISLFSNGFDIDTISLDNKDIPANTNLLVLADPKSALSTTSQGKISNYITQGGSMFIMGEPGKQQMVNPVLQQLGVQLEDGLILTESKQEAQDMVTPSVNKPLFSLMKYPESPVFKDVPAKHMHLIMPGVASIKTVDTTDFTVTSLSSTSRNITWIRKGPFVRDSAKVKFRESEGDLRATPAFGTAAAGNIAHHVHSPDEVPDKHIEEKEGYDGDGFNTLIAMQRTTGGKDQRILVAGDADFLSNARSLQVSRFANYFYSWLVKGTYPIYIPRVDPPDKLLSITGNTAQTQRIVFLYIIPAALLLFATTLLIRRKRK